MSSLGVLKKTNTQYLHDSGFIVNPNVGAALVVDGGVDDVGVNNGHLQAFLSAHRGGYIIEDLPLHFFSLRQTFEDDLSTGNRCF